MAAISERAKTHNRESAEYAASFRRYLLTGRSDGLAENYDEMTTAEVRAMTTIGSQGGGFWVSPEFQKTMTLAANEASPIRNACALAGSIIETASGSNLTMPLIDDTLIEGELLNEESGEQATETNVAASSVNIPTYTFSSGILLISNQLLQDGAAGMADGLAQALSRRIARREDRSYVMGQTATEPQGLMASAAVGVTAVGTATITSDEVLSLIDAAPSAWRFSEHAKLLMNSDTFSKIRLLKDGQGAYLCWDPATNRIHGREVVIDSNVPAPATGARSVAYVNFGSFIVRDAGPANLLVLRERWARDYRTGFLAYARKGSILRNIGSVPAAVVLVQA